MPQNCFTPQGALPRAKRAHGCGKGGCRQISRRPRATQNNSARQRHRVVGVLSARGSVMAYFFVGGCDTDTSAIPTVIYLFFVSFVNILSNVE